MAVSSIQKKIDMVVVRVIFFLLFLDIDRQSLRLRGPDGYFFYLSLQNLYHISVSLIAQMSSKLGKIRTETRSWRPNGRSAAIFFLICVISGKPDQIARPLL